MEMKLPTWVTLLLLWNAQETLSWLAYPASLPMQKALPRTTTLTFSALSEDQEKECAKRKLSFREIERESLSLIDDTQLGSWNHTTVDTAISLCRALFRMSFRYSIITAEKIIRRMCIERGMHAHVTYDKMAPLYESLINSWAKSGEAGGPERAEEILTYMITNHPTDFATHQSTNSLASILPSSEMHEKSWPKQDSFNVIVWAFARSSQPNAAGKATQFLSKWYNWYNTGKMKLVPDATAYAAILFALAKHNPALQSSEPLLVSSDAHTFDAPKAVLNLLEQMEKLSNDYPAVAPDLACYHKYFVALQESEKRGQLAQLEGAQLADAHLKRMLEHPYEKIHPDGWAFSSVIRAWAHSSSVDSVEICESLIELHEEYHAMNDYSEKTRPLIYSYNHLLDCYARSRLVDKVERSFALLRRLENDFANNESPSTRVNSYTYNSIMNCCAKSNKRMAPEMAEDLLKEMWQKQQKRGDPFVKVTVRSINVCLNAWAKSGRRVAPQKIRSWIDTMIRRAQNGEAVLAPNRVSFNTYLQALAKREQKDNVCDIADGVIREMLKLDGSGYVDIKPDIVTYTNVLHCYSTSKREDALDRSLALLDQLEEMHASGQGDMRPSRLTMNCVVNAAAKSPRPGKAKIAEGLLRRMESVSLKPVAVTYNSLLNACAFSNHPDDDPEEVLEIANRTLTEARSRCCTNSISFMTMLRVVSSQVKNQEIKWKLVNEIVDMCANDGHLNQSIMNGARLNVSPRNFQKLRDRVTDDKGNYYEDYCRQANNLKMRPMEKFSYNR